MPGESIVTSVLAYVGPGAGLSAIGALFALIGAVFLAIVGFLWYPIRRLLRRLKKPPEVQKPSPTEGDSNK